MTDEEANEQDFLVGKQIASMLETEGWAHINSAIQQEVQRLSVIGLNENDSAKEARAQVRAYRGLYALMEQLVNKGEAASLELNKQREADEKKTKSASK